MKQVRAAIVSRREWFVYPFLLHVPCEKGKRHGGVITGFDKHNFKFGRLPGTYEIRSSSDYLRLPAFYKTPTALFCLLI